MTDPATSWGAPLPPVYGPADVPADALGAALGAPGQFPFTRGIHAEMY
ncbi:MAG: hypothetical protein HYS37_04975, partial [Candidatus Rokubacteria bacterium]|nr:hypothetical protein [Candidatus Rokubacteria bacterium]